MTSGSWHRFSLGGFLSGLVVAMWLGGGQISWSQSAESYEFMSASSPLKNGWTVTSQSLPGRPISTVVTPGVAGQGMSSPNGVTLVPTSAQYPLTGVGSSAGGAPAATYSGGSWVWVPNQGYTVAPNGVPVMTQPSLGITSTNALKPNVPSPLVPTGLAPYAANTSPGYPGSGAGYQWAAPGVGASVPPYTTGVPTVPFAPPPALPGTIPTSHSLVSNTPGVSSAPATTTAYYPYVTGNFQPLIATQNMPPGTYMGRGILGQPTAYVDGQPMRNLFRYIFP